MSAYLVTFHISEEFEVIADNNNPEKSYRILARPQARGECCNFTTSKILLFYVYFFFSFCKFYCDVWLWVKERYRILEKDNGVYFCIISP